MRKVKLFESSDIEKLETEINKFLEQHSDIVDIKLSSSATGNETSNYQNTGRIERFNVAMIIYEV